MTLMMDTDYWDRSTQHPLAIYFVQFKWFGRDPNYNVHVYRCSTAIFNTMHTKSHAILPHNPMRVCDDDVADNCRILMWCRKHRPSQITDAIAAMTLLTDLPIVLVRSFSIEMQEAEQRAQWNIAVDNVINDLLKVSNELQNPPPFVIETDPEVWAKWAEGKQLMAEDVYNKLKEQQTHVEPQDDHTGQDHRDDGLVPEQ